jgi:hypothetical protein
MTFLPLSIKIDNWKKSAPSFSTNNRFHTFDGKRKNELKNEGWIILQVQILNMICAVFNPIGKM